MEGLRSLLEWSQNIAYLAIGIWAWVRWRRTGNEQSQWLAATFGSLAFAVTVGVITRDMAPSTTLDWITRINVTVLLPFPYYLLRFLDSFEPVSRRLRRAIGLGSVVAVLLALSVPSLLDPEQATAPLNRAFALVVVTVWVVALSVVSRRFWRAGSGQPTIVRRRLRILSLGSAMLSFAIIASGANPGGASDAVTVVTQVFGLLAAALFLVGLAPPTVLRTYWRQAEELQLHHASVQLMSTTTAQEVADILVPQMRSVIAADGVALTQHGRVLAAEGVTRERVEALGEVAVEGHRALPISDGTVHVWANRYTPFFDEGEEALLSRLTLLADLAIDRAKLFALEQAARAELQEANAELESFVYSASHDLKSPVIALQGYVDVISADYGSHFDEQGRWYLERMRTNCRYMEQLVGDLLELSRVGRVDDSPTEVDLAGVVEEIARGVREQHPTASVVAGDLPRVWMNDLRVHQLLRNLIENAVAHGAVDEPQVDVRCEPAPDVPGGVVLLVRDNGVGVPPEYRERIFGVFERLEAVGDGAPGTGIGLAICRKIAESVGGRIWVTDHDGGAEFAVLLPPTLLTPPEDAPGRGAESRHATEPNEVPA